MPEKNKKNGYLPKEQLVSILPAVLAGIVSLIATTVTAIIEFPSEDGLQGTILIVYGILGSLYLACFYYFFVNTSNRKLPFAWINAVIAGISLGLLSLILPDEMDVMLSALIVVATILSAVISDRPPSYFIIASASVILLIVRREEFGDIYEWTEHLTMAILAILAIETIQQLKGHSRKQIKQLEIVNEFSRQITTSLDTSQVIEKLNITIQNALRADTYFVGMTNGDEITLPLFFDDGEYFEDKHVKRAGTLSNWVIQNQTELFLPDLRKEINLKGVDNIVIGKQKTSFSWMGAPMRGEFIDGVIAIASYRPNDFHLNDMELLSNMAQLAALALDNTFRHALVEEQAHNDSLTDVYNHGYFIKILKQQAEYAMSQGEPLSLIMLDVDYFKQYNDTYGHLVGDEVLTRLCKTIRGHVKYTDSVGRWGGEEFAISLPNTDGEQAMQIADRIRTTMAALKIQTHDLKTNIPAPTVSQGIAVFPHETCEIMKLIDLADSRLYTAKNQGRNQIEPLASHWET